MTMNQVLGLGLGIAALGAMGSGAAAAADPAAAKKVFLDNKCSGCHSVKSEGIAVDEKMAENDGDEDKGEAKGGKKPDPPDLSNAGSQKAEFLDGWLRKKETIEGRKHPRRFSGTPEDRETLVAWLASLKTADTGKAKATGK